MLPSRSLLRVLGPLPLKDEATGSGGRGPRSLRGGNRGPGWHGGAADSAYLWGFEIGVCWDVVAAARLFDKMWMMSAVEERGWTIVE